MYQITTKSIFQETGIDIDSLIPESRLKEKIKRQLEGCYQYHPDFYRCVNKDREQYLTEKIKELTRVFL